MTTSCVGRHKPSSPVSKQNWCQRQPCRARRNLDLLTVGHTLRRNESRYPIRASQGGGDDRAPWRQRATSRIRASYKPPPPLSYALHLFSVLLAAAAPCHTDRLSPDRHIRRSFCSARVPRVSPRPFPAARPTALSTMARLLLPLAAFAALAPLVSAGIQFTSPAPGDKLTAGNAINIEWEEGGTGPKLTDLATYNLFLCAGGDGTLPVCESC
jgi:hypothetical protein